MMEKNYRSIFYLLTRQPKHAWFNIARVWMDTTQFLISCTSLCACTPCASNSLSAHAHTKCSPLSPPLPVSSVSQRASVVSASLLNADENVNLQIQNVPNSVLYGTVLTQKDKKATQAYFQEKSQFFWLE